MNTLAYFAQRSVTKNMTFYSIVTRTPRTATKGQKESMVAYMDYKKATTIKNIGLAL
jgi:hypothetical protein